MIYKGPEGGPYKSRSSAMQFLDEIANNNIGFRNVKQGYAERSTQTLQQQLNETVPVRIEHYQRQAEVVEALKKKKSKPSFFKTLANKIMEKSDKLDNKKFKRLSN